MTLNSEKVQRYRAINVFAKALSDFHAPAAKLPAGNGYPSDAFKGIQRHTLVVPAYSAGVTEYTTVWFAPGRANNVFYGRANDRANATGNIFIGGGTDYSPSGLLYSSGNFAVTTKLAVRTALQKVRITNTSPLLSRSGTVYSGVAPAHETLAEMVVSTFMSRPWVAVNSATAANGHVAEMTWQATDPNSWVSSVSSSQAPEMVAVIPCQAEAQSYLIETCVHVEYRGANIAGTPSHVSNDKYYTLTAALTGAGTASGDQSIYQHAVRIANGLLGTYGPPAARAALTYVSNSVYGRRHPTHALLT